MQKNKSRLGYKRTTLGAIAEIYSGGTPSRARPDFWGGSIPWVKTANICDRTILESDIDEWITEEGLEASAAKMVPKGTILMAMYGQGKTRGRVAVLGLNATVNQACAAISLQRSVSREFIFQQLLSRYSAIRQMSNSGGQDNLSAGLIREIPVHVPSLPEQEAIASVLECWDKAIRGYDRKIEKKRNIKKGLMQRLLSGKQRLPGFDGEWKEVRLGKLAAIDKGQQLNRLDQTESGNYPVLNGGVQPLGYTDEWNTEANTITISEGGNSCGFVSFNRERFWCGGHCYALSEKATLVDKEFLYQSLKHRQISIMRLRVGSGLPNIQKKTLGRFLINLPPLPEQQSIAAVLSSADAEISVLDRKLAAFREQKRFLLNNMVTGTIRFPQFVGSRTADTSSGDTE